MDEESVATRRINVTFPAAVLEAIDEILPSRQRNRFIVEATELALQSAQMARVLKELRSAPAWSEENHPDLATVEDIDDYVRALRNGWLPRTTTLARPDVTPNA